MMMMTMMTGEISRNAREAAAVVVEMPSDHDAS